MQIDIKPHTADQTCPKNPGKPMNRYTFFFKYIFILDITHYGNNYLGLMAGFKIAKVN